MTLEEFHKKKTISAEELLTLTEEQVNKIANAPRKGRGPGKAEEYQRRRRPMLEILRDK